MKNQNQNVYFHCSNKRTIANKKIYKTNAHNEEPRRSLVDREVTQKKHFSQVELASQGDSIYDFVDKEDHDQVRTQLDAPPHDDRGEARRLTFFCRMSTSRYMKTQMRSWKNKVGNEVGMNFVCTVLVLTCVSFKNL